MIRTLLASTLLCTASTAALADAHEAPAMQAAAELVDAAGANVGSATIRTTPSGRLLFTISATGLTPGWHSLHIHETGACDGASGFESAGGHLAGDAEHGFLAKGGPHPGDMPNQMVPASGEMTAEVAPEQALTMEMVLDSDGSSVMIHSGQDDYTSQPAGDAGDRVVCGVLKLVE